MEAVSTADASVVSAQAIAVVASVVLPVTAKLPATVRFFFAVIFPALD
jgi:hypothetical protein